MKKKAAQWARETPDLKSLPEHKPKKPRYQRRGEHKL
jgi:hypothetical protein